MVNLQDDLKEHAQWNERMVQKYDPDLYHQHQNPVIRWIESCRVRGVLKYIPQDESAQVLEVGCGAGNVLAQVRSKVRHGVDLSRFILRKAQNRLGASATVLCSTAEYLPYQDAQFDCVYCTEVIEHTIDPQVVIKEMLRVLKPRGVLIVTVPNEGLIDRLKGVIESLGLYRLFFSSGEFSSPKSNEWHLHNFDKEMLVQVMGTGWERRRIDPIPLFLLPLRYVAMGIKPEDV